MSLPNIPDIDPEITLTREEVNNLLLSSIAMEEISLSHLLNAEAEKIQKIINKKGLSTKEAFRTQESVEKLLRNVIKTQMLLQFKLEDVLKSSPIDFDFCDCCDCDCDDCDCDDCDCDDCDCDDCEEMMTKKKRVPNAEEMVKMVHKASKQRRGKKRR